MISEYLCITAYNAYNCKAASLLDKICRGVNTFKPKCISLKLTDMGLKQTLHIHTHMGLKIYFRLKLTYVELELTYIGLKVTYMGLKLTYTPMDIIQLLTKGLFTF